MNSTQARASLKINDASGARFDIFSSTHCSCTPCARKILIPDCLAINRCNKGKSDDDNEADKIHPIFGTVKFCKRMFPPINGQVMGSNQVGNVMEFRCDPGYTLVGKQKSRCMRNGFWSDLPPKCKRKSPSLLFNITIAKISPFSTGKVIEKATWRSVFLTL